MRIELAKLLLQKPDVLLLDEPTNHLDIESIQWLEDFLISNGKAVIVISHDRKFVDNITTRTIEVTMGRIYDYKVNYSKYLELRKERREQQQKAYDDQQKFIAETKEFIERFKGTYSKTLQVQSRVKMLEKLELLEVDEEDTSALRLKFPPSPRSGNYPVIMEGVGKSYGDHVVFKNANLTIERGDKVAFVGKNGEGKSTLVKCIMKEIEHEGTLTIGHNVQIGYFAQNQASLLDENLTVFQTIDDVAKGNPQQDTRPAGCLHVRWPRRVHEEGQGAFRWRAHTPRHDKAFARTGESADTGRTDQPSGHENQRYPEASVTGF